MTTQQIYPLNDNICFTTALNIVHQRRRCHSISIAFQTLSAPALRSKYHEFGTRVSVTESVFVVDPEEVFGKIFAGERSEAEWEEGEGKVIRDGNLVVSEERTRKKAAERALAGTERFTRFSTNLDATGINDEDVMTSWRTICELEADVQGKYQVLMKCTFSFSLLPSLSLSYLIYNRRLITSNPYSGCRKSGSLSPAERQKLEEQPAGKGLQALFKGEKLAVDSALREIQMALREKAVLRAVALQILGDAYMRVRTRKEKDVNSSNHSTNSSSSSSGLGIGTGLGNLDNDIGSGLGGMFGLERIF
ncbi:hypothetical protein C8J55DRAFT_541293 [Lentinula edodes]|uniref:Uncharacterized protein n=1 Tax=Lentinula lateritia TaxID=40482 RepID=A0A9W9DWQ5_9AGAR|nr:hypothetical protein C8J55DRAFT_541293 [Lentinula edodes]